MVAVISAHPYFTNESVTDCFSVEQLPAVTSYSTLLFWGALLPHTSASSATSGAFTTRALRNSNFTGCPPARAATVNSLTNLRKP